MQGLKQQIRVKRSFYERSRDRSAKREVKAKAVSYRHYGSGVFDRFPRCRQVEKDCINVGSGAKAILADIAVFQLDRVHQTMIFELLPTGSGG
jgi:hypothetical protein